MKPVRSMPFALLACSLLTLPATAGDRESHFHSEDGSSGTSFEVNVDARANCVEVFTGAPFNAVSHPIPTGFYKVSAKSNAHYCVGGCAVDKVAFFITTDDQPHGWFHVVNEKEPIFINVSGIGFDANSVWSFFIDGLCGDNSGGARLLFRQVDQIPSVCSGFNC